MAVGTLHELAGVDARSDELPSCADSDACDAQRLLRQQPPQGSPVYNLAGHLSSLQGGSSTGDEPTGGTKKAAAAMAVGVGSFSDPVEAQGLSHFLEVSARQTAPATPDSEVTRDS